MIRKRKHTSELRRWMLTESPLPTRNPEHAAPQRETVKAVYKVLRPRVREDTFVRDGMRCRACQAFLKLFSDNPFDLANIHERTGGSQRKVEAVDITLKSTITLCAGCHTQLEHHKLHDRVLDEEAGYNGPVEFTGVLATGDRLREPYISAPVLTGAWRIAARDQIHDNG